MFDTQGTDHVVITTAAGGMIDLPVQFAGPISRSALIVNADQRGPIEVLVTDQRGVDLFGFSECRFRPILNPQGQQYQFDLGNRSGAGTGVGCVTTPDGRRLVGLEHPDGLSGDPGTAVPWTRTIIDLNGFNAHNGARMKGTYTYGPDDTAIGLLDDISCGNLTIERDGIQESEN